MPLAYHYVQQYDRLKESESERRGTLIKLKPR